MTTAIATKATPMDTVLERSERILKRDIKRRLSKIQSGLRTAVQAAWETGQLLVAIKQKTKHGNMPKLYAELGIEPRNGQKYMQLYQGFTLEAALGQQTITGALSYLAEKKKEQNDKDGQGELLGPDDNPPSSGPASSSGNNTVKTSKKTKKGESVEEHLYSLSDTERDLLVDLLYKKAGRAEGYFYEDIQRLIAKLTSE